MRTLREMLPKWSRVLLKTKTIAPTLDLHSVPDWRALYVAALFENDQKRMVYRIAEAKKALIQRARELFQTAGDHLQEQSAIEDALQSLHALEQCVAYPCLLRH
jgi:hypothetical protein